MVTIEISGSGIRLLETDGDRVTSWASHSIEPGIFEDGIVADPEALGAIIKELVSSSGIKGNRVTASVSGLYSISRIVIVPTPPEVPVAEQAVLEAVEEILPLSDEAIYLSWHSIGVGEGGHQVMVHAVPREMIDNQMRALRIAGINTRVLNLKTMALARAVNREEALILNIEPDSFDIVMVIDGLAEVMRTTAWQQDDLTIEEKAEYLVSALELTVSFYEANRPNFPFNRSNPLFVTGQMSGDLDLVEKIRESVEYTAAEIKTTLNYPEHLPVSQYATNIGLVLQETASGEQGESGYLTPDINLLPKAFQPWKPSPKQIYLSLAFIAALALLFPLYTLTTDAQKETETLENQFNSINSLLDLRRVELANFAPLQQVIDDYNTIVGLGGGFVEDMNVIEEKAEELDVVVDQINHLGKFITFNCQTENYLVFRQFKTALEQSGRFSTPITPPEGYPYVKSGNIKLEPVRQ